MALKPDRVIPIQLVGQDEIAIHTAHWFASQIVGPDEILLAVGQVHTPILLGDSPQEIAAAAAAVAEVPVRVVGKFSLSVDRCEALIAALTATVNAYKKAERAG